jgi:NAD(P)-dependent dehydrogenase (short-subunit alcohol dehydrogenase family)/acyl dehydratase
MFAEARLWLAEQLRVGLRADFEREISEADVLAFAEQSGDGNPLHVDSDYARASNYQGRIVHGAFQVALASALVGMHLPGRRVLLGAINARFPAPLYFPCRVCVGGEITAWDRSLNAGQVRVVVRQAASQTPTAEIVMSFTLHETRQRRSVASDAPAATQAAAGAPVLLVTGASGGIGEAIVRGLAGPYCVLGQCNCNRVAEDLRTHAAVTEVKLDLALPDWEERIAALLDGRPLYGIIHAAWPGAPHGGLLQCGDDLIERQIRFGTTYPVRLARLLFARAGAEGGRMIVLGSSAGSTKPVLSMAGYSLGKAALETTMRLLAPEMARKKITVNAICPAFVAAGINKQADKRQQLMEAARAPLGRLCTQADIVAAIEYLLSPSASFVSGQVLGLAGGQL